MWSGLIVHHCPPRWVYRHCRRFALIYSTMVVCDDESLEDIQQMAITGAYTRISLRYTYLGQKCQNIAYYQNVGVAFLTATMAEVLEAYWNDVKAALRALTSTAVAVGTWDSILGEEIGGGGSYAEYAIPTAERPGTRGVGNDGEWVTGVLAVGARLVVGTHATRPGQKRLPFLREGDITGDQLLSTAITLFQPAMQKFSQNITLGAPVALGVLTPVVGGTVVGGYPTVFQVVTGLLMNTNVTSQVSRKAGHGA